MHRRHSISWGLKRIPKVRIKILDATLFVTQIELNSPLLLAHANVFGMKRKAHYPVTHTQIKIFTASSGAQQVSIDNAFLGPIPERILLGLVKNTDFLGSASTNAFHFHHYDMTSLVLYVNGVQYPSEPFTMDCLHLTELQEPTKHSSPVPDTLRWPSADDCTGYVHQGFLRVTFRLDT